MTATEAVPTRERLWLGRETPPSEPLHLVAGPVELDIDGIDVRGVMVAGREVVNRIYVGIRDTDWNTLPPVVDGFAVERRPDGTVAATFDARHDGAGIAYRWRGSITVFADGRLVYDMQGVAERAFRHNRVGFCVLHPAAQAGRPYHATTPAGRHYGTLPTLIEPQSIVDGLEVPLFPACSALTVDLGDAAVEVAFEGDLFEMEDQRNWTDASFKTYCTPIALGYPHSVDAGHVFHQRITVRVTGSAEARRPVVAGPRSPGRLDLAVGDVGYTWPAFGLGLATGDAARAAEDGRHGWIAALRIDHLRHDLRLSHAGWSDALDRALVTAADAGARLELALFASDETAERLHSAAERLRDPRVARIIALHEPTAGTSVTPDSWLVRIANAIGAADAGVPPVFTGTDGDFAELNRDRPPMGRAAGVAYAANPQVHASDERSLVESLPIHAQTIATARSFVDDSQVALSPITLKGRFNPAAADPSAQPSEAPADDRQPSLFAGGWLLGSIASVVAGGADSVTWFETVGPRGVVGTAGPYPAWFVLADLADRAGWTPLRLGGGTGPTVTGLAMRRGGETRILVANVTAHPVPIALDGVPATRATVRVLDAQTAAAAFADPEAFRSTGLPAAVDDGRIALELPPFGYARVDARA